MMGASGGVNTTTVNVLVGVGLSTLLALVGWALTTIYKSMVQMGNRLDKALAVMDQKLDAGLAATERSHAKMDRRLTRLEAQYDMHMWAAHDISPNFPSFGHRRDLPPEGHS